MKYSHQRYLRYFVDIQLLSTSKRSFFYDLINCRIEFKLGLLFDFNQCLETN